MLIRGVMRFMSWRHVLLVGVCWASFIYSPAAALSTYVIPPSAQNVDGQNGAGELHQAMHIQTLYGASLFNAGPMLIQEIRFRPSALYGFAFTSTIPNIQVNLSTTTVDPEALSASFANNRGTNDTIVFQGPITLSSQFTGPASGPKAFDIIFPLTTPFAYDPAAGNLLVEIRNFSNNNNVTYLDVIGVAGDHASRVFSVDPNAASGSADTGSDIIRLGYSVPSSAPVITAQPPNLNVPLGSSATFSVGVYGSQPLSYQWSFQSANLLDATNSTLVLTNVTFAHQGLYGVVITNFYGQAVSSNAELKVYEIMAAPVLREPPGPSSRRTPLAISEIMYHPAPRSDGRKLEFIEIHNSAAVPQKLDGFRIAGDVDFSFPINMVLAPDARLVVAANASDIAAVYGIANVVGNFTKSLPNGSGTVQLRNRSDAVLLEITYSDAPPWPVAADGAGHSLVLARPSFGEGNPLAWDASAVIGGSAGGPEPAISDAGTNIVINEILAQNSEAEQNFIELYNHGRNAVDLSGCFLTDDPATNKFRIADLSPIPARGFLAFTQAQLGFSLDPTGGRIFLVNSNRTRVIDAVRNGPQAADISWGRSPDGAPQFSELAAQTSGASNAPPLARDIIINEIMYHPISGLIDDEFVELYNRGSHPVNVGGWRLVDGISFIFPANTILSADSYLVVAKNTLRLLTNYPSLGPANLMGDFTGSLSHHGQHLALTMPQIILVTNALNAAITTNLSYVVVNELTYGVGGQWGKWANGGGASLELIDPNSDNRLGANWADSAPPTDSPWTTIEYTGSHEFWDGNSPINGLEISLLGEGECLVDDVEVYPAGGANQLTNPSFSGGATGWNFDGNHDFSSVTNSGGIGDSACLHLRAAGRGDYLGSRVWTQWSSPLSMSVPATLRAKVRWLRGWPEILLRLRGNTIEATGPLAIAAGLGTPGRANSRWVPNAGPAIYDVSHSPVLPAANEAVVVAARVSDPTGISSLALRYRVDPSADLSSLTMRDDGMGGDAVAGDGVYSAIIPGQPSGQLVAFHIGATDSAGASTLFPNDAPARECLVRFGELQTAGSFGTYRLWMTAATVSNWTYRSSAQINGRPLDLTFVYNNQRVIYNAGGAFNGSDNTSELYDTPQQKLCGYTLIFPDDDQFLGASQALLDWPTRDASAQREQLTYWMANEVGLPFNYRRYVHLHVNGVTESQRVPLLWNEGLIFEDLQSPGADYLNEWYPLGPNGDLFKFQVWRRDYKFPARPSPNSEPYHASLENFTDLAGKKHLARYRWGWRKRNVSGSANDDTTLFELVDAANIPDANNFIAALESVADVEEWMRIFAFERCIGNYDSYGNRTSQNMYAYKPGGAGRWQLHTFDNDLVFGGQGASEDPTADLFGIYSPPAPGVGIPDPVIARMRSIPAFQRAYWRAFKDFVNGPMMAANYLPFANAQYAALRANGVQISGNTLASPADFSGWIDSRRSFILGQLAAVNASFALNFPGGIISTNQNALTLAGTAPIDVKSIRVNGVERAVTWTGVTTWSLLVALAPGTNSFSLQAFDRLGNPVAGASGNATVNFTGGADAPDQSLIINEIMYHPAVTNGEFIEIFNRSPATTFDLSGWRINGLDFTFPGGSTIAPLDYLVAAKDRVVFGRTYGFNIPVVGEFQGSFDQGGETLSLIQVAGTNEVVIDTVTYDDDLPWPPAADGLGSSLQLIDTTQDNNRVANWAAASATPGRANSIVTNLPPFPMLWINEIEPNNFSGLLDNAAERDPWVEIYNSGTNVLDLTGFYLSDNFTNPTRWAFPAGAAVDAQTFTLIWLDGEPAQNTANDWHAGFRISPTNGSLALVRVLNNRTSVVDYLNYSLAAVDQSFGSVPDGAPHSRHWFFYPTPGTTNNPAAPPPPIRINEWMAGNTHILADPTYGGYPDWFELFNSSSEAVDLAGWRLTDNLANPAKFIIPSGVVVSNRGFLLVWADGRSGLTNGALHVNFQLSRNGENIALFDPRGTLVDSIAFGQQTNDVSQGRWPNGANGPFYWMPIPTPGGPNTIPNPPEVRVTGVTVDSDRNITLTWAATPGLVYRMQYKQHLEDEAWTDLPGDVLANTPFANKTDQVPFLQRQRFYRLVAGVAW